MTAQPLAFDDFDDLAQLMIHLAFKHSTNAGEPLGAVIAGVIYHLALEAMLNDCPEKLLYPTIVLAGDAYRDLGRIAPKGDACQ
jgi:hypothetical protein